MRCFKISYITSIPISRCNTNSNWVRGRLLSILLYLNKKKIQGVFGSWTSYVPVCFSVGWSVCLVNQSVCHSLLTILSKLFIYRVFRKNCVFSQFTASPPLYRCKRPSKLSTQCECSVTPIGWSLIVQPIAAECWRGRGGKLSRVLCKKHNI